MMLRIVRPFCVVSKSLVKRTNFAYNSVALSSTKLFSTETEERKPIVIKMEKTPNPDSFKFNVPDRSLLPEGSTSGVHISSYEQALKIAPKLKSLFATPSIEGVFVGKDFVSVNRDESMPTDKLKFTVMSCLMDAISQCEAEGTPLIQEAKQYNDTAYDSDDDDVVVLIKELIETRIRPGLQEDGGDIYYEGFNEADGMVRLRLAGSCVGCPSSTATLKGGVENMLKHYIPEVRGIIEVKSPLDTVSDKEFDELEKKLESA